MPKGINDQAGNRSAKTVVIVGGGTAGWMTAASLAHALGPLGVHIRLIESSQIGTVGVGEATVPAIRRYFESLDLSTYDVMKACNGSFKLGIAFENWRQPGHRFFHSFGRYGAAHGQVGFHHLWQRLVAAGVDRPLDDYCLGTQLAYAGRFAEPIARPRADFEIYDWAIHFDASLFARVLRQFAEAKGVERIDAKVSDIALTPETGEIAHLVLDQGDRIAGDLFIDCSGFRGLLIQGALKTGYRDWRHWLPCDRAIALPCAQSDPQRINPYTRARAQSAGWTWQIPLQHRIGNGYVYSSDHIGDAEAEATLRDQLGGDALAEPNLVRFTTGHAERLWNRNCVAIGLAGGFLEPLESTSITLIQMAIDKLILLWPGERSDPRLADEFNRLSVLEYERIRDFIILHYCLNGRIGEGFWDQCREMAIPDTLRHKIELFKARGQFARYDMESFFDPSWLCMYEGFGVVPQTNNPFAEQMPIDRLKAVTTQMCTGIKAMAMDGIPHYDFIKTHCATARG
jgi:tryptophan halogenase